MMSTMSDTSALPDRMHAITDETRTTVDDVLQYARRRALYEDIPLDKPMRPSDLARLASGSITAAGIGDRRAIALFENVLAPACISTDHPGYLAFIPSAPTKASLAFDVVVSASAIYGGSWIEGAGAVYAENEVLAWLAGEFGMPDTAGGVFVQGGTIGNLSALVTARDAARRRNREAGVADPARWVVVCSAEAHSSIASAAAVMDIEIVAAAVDGDGRMHGDAVAAALDAHGGAVFAVVATGGTTNFGIVDDIASIAAVTAARDVWLHVDGAYGLAAMLVPEMRDAFAGVASADSVIVDPHKWLFAPFDACALIYRDPALALAAHTQKAEYLDTLTGKPDWNPSDLAVQLTRRARGLPLWFSLATHGTDAYRAGIRHGIDLARRIADDIAARPELSLVREPQLSVVVFRREGWTLADYEAWSDRLLDEQRAFVVPSSHAGEPVLRFAIISPLTTYELLVDILDSLD
ncbi:L-2,4-diaminobutyrate decarboxylase [Microbacterium terrae]|uniref:L-2,4-diaminobutyrate decarboxylase n=2 Tax=Microbacterium terrae TaxID=69369 RepID=A0A0M2H882_9MICO|nr:L-2,4-diaminobutyrate decarboxylase [Microbacterium terrae]